MRQGYSPKKACEKALSRVIKAHNGSPDFQIGFIAMRKDGEVGSACIKWSFDYVVSKNRTSKLYKVVGVS